MFGADAGAPELHHLRGDGADAHLRGARAPRDLRRRRHSPGRLPAPVRSTPRSVSARRPEAGRLQQRRPNARTGRTKGRPIEVNIHSGWIFTFSTEDRAWLSVQNSNVRRNKIYVYSHVTCARKRHLYRLSRFCWADLC